MASDIEKPFLPFDIITNILTRLPIKSIVKFQCVCKAWKNLFKTQSFISQHTLHTSHQNPFLLIHAYDRNHHRSTVRLLNHNMETTEVLNTHFIDSFTRGWTIVGSTKGLICVALAAEARRSPTSYLVWNPVTNEVREVPPSINKNSPSVGFGYSSVVDDYKIVRFYHKDYVFNPEDIGYEMLYGVQVFSLRSGSWTELELGDSLSYIEIYHRPAHVNGTIVWYGSGSPFEMLITFDIATDVFTIVSIDSLSANENADGELEHGYCPHNVYEYGNKLAMSCISIDDVNDEVRVYNILMWVIEEGAGEFGKSYSCTGRYKFEMIDVVNPMCFWRNQIVCRYDVGNKAEGDKRNCLHMFNLISKEWNKFPNFSDAYDFCAIFNYEKSLRTSLQHLG